MTVRGWVFAAAFALGAFGGVAAAQNGTAAAPKPEAGATAIFAGGCFWCVESDFDKVDGVVDTLSGYTGGTLDNPTYRDVTGERTGHYEAVQVTYDPKKVSYRTLVDYFFRHVDPTDADGQFCDRGPSYRTAIFVAGPEQRADAEAAKAAADAALGTKTVTPVIDAKTFYPAEDYHQNYYQTNSLKYKYYRWGCGRDERIQEVWQNAKPAS